MSSKKGQLAQFNIRMDSELLKEYKEFCRRNGLDPQQQIINYIERIVRTQYNFQEKLWEVIQKSVISSE